jgi:hypothetical protein
MGTPKQDTLRGSFDQQSISRLDLLEVVELIYRTIRDRDNRSCVP